jgi:hypothetical protein
LFAVLGAEKQAATSAALAYPELEFVFLSEEPVLDGWDLANVRFERARPSELATISQRFGERVIPLCGRWVVGGLGYPRNRFGRFDLSIVLPALKRVFPANVATISTVPPTSNNDWILKGDKWHRPDAVVTGPPLELVTVEDAHGCGRVFQPLLSSETSYLVTGYRWTERAADVAIIRLYGEVHCRENLVTAGETVEDRAIFELAIRMLETVDHFGWFSMKWLRVDGAPMLCSFRPLASAVLQTMRRGGLDTLLNRPKERRIANAGIRFIADNTYTSYEVL